MHKPKTTPRGRQRAPRHQLIIATRYRRVGEDGWSTGETVNISRSGVLLAAGSQMCPGETVQARIALSAVEPQAADVWTEGRVVRVSRHEAHDRYEVAVTIDEYRFERSVGLRAGDDDGTL